MKAVVVFALTGALLAGAAGAAEILVKGLTEGSAILSIDGEITILREGESRGNVKLIRADNRGAVLEIGGKRSTIGLDRSIAKTYRPPEPERTARAGSAFLYRQEGEVVSAASSLLSIKVVDEQPGRVGLGVEYIYSGDYGSEVFLTVATLSRNRPTGYTAPSPVRLLKGKHYVELDVASADDAPLVYRTDELQLTVHWEDGEVRRGDILKRVLPFSKNWKKVRVR